MELRWIKPCLLLKVLGIAIGGGQFVDCLSYTICLLPNMYWLVHGICRRTGQL